MEPCLEDLKSYVLVTFAQGAIMKKDDLTQIKHIGAARMNFLNDSGIMSIKKLCETPLEKLSQIQGIGDHYAKLIKASATEIYGKKSQKSASKTAPGKQKKTKKINQQLQKQFKALLKRLKQVNENLKPLGKKKYLPAYIDFKKRAKTLRIQLNTIVEKQDKLSKKDKKKIIKNAGILDSSLKAAGKKPSKKNYKKVIMGIQAFSKLLK